MSTTVVLGATGGAGRALVAHLAATGRPVRAVSRRPAPPQPGVEVVAADVTDPGSLRWALSGAAVVHHAAQPVYTRWDLFPTMTAGIADAAARAGARLVLADNLYAHGPVDGPITESTPLAATDRKGRIRAQMARDLLDRHTRGDLEVVLGRASDHLGPGVTRSAFGDPLVGRALAGKSVQALASADQPHSVGYLPDVAAALVTLGEAPGAAGRAWNLPVPPPVTVRELAALVAAELGRPVRVSVARPALLRALGLAVPVLREVAATVHQWDRPFVVDDSAYRHSFGPVEPTALPVAVRRTLAGWGMPSATAVWA